MPDFDADTAVAPPGNHPRFLTAEACIHGLRGHRSLGGVIQAAIAGRMGLAVSEYDESSRLPNADVIIDAMVGYSLIGPLRGQAADAAGILATGPAPVISLDVPSGLDTSSETTAAAGSVTADATLTLCLPKTALRNASGAGDLYLADISVPPRVVTDSTGGPAPPFSRGRILQLLP